MAMKTKDVSVAVSLIIQGYLRANVDHEEDATGPRSVANKELAKAIQAARRELSDWEENLEGDDAALAVARAS